MRESCTYGVVRGALSNERPYRDQVGNFDFSNGLPLGGYTFARAATHTRSQLRVNFCRSSPDGHVRFGQLRTWAKLWQRRDGPQH